MNKPEFFVTPGYGERQLGTFHYSQAVKIANRVETFRNVERTLATAGAMWEHVIQVNSYHVGFPEEVNQTMTERFRHYMPDHAPIWTALGVAALGDPKMRVEIRVTAILPG